MSAGAAPLPRTPVISARPSWKLYWDASRAPTTLGSLPCITFQKLVAEMMRDDAKSAERDQLAKEHGYPAYD